MELKPVAKGADTSHVTAITNARSGRTCLSVMLNELVLDKVAKELPPVDILSLRQTCALWNGILIPEISERQSPNYPFRVKITGTPSPRIPTGYCVLEECTSTMRSSPSTVHTPYRNYCMFNPFNSSEVDLAEFFSLCGSSIRELELAWTELPGGEADIARIREIVFRSTPELKSLALNAYDEFSESIIPVGWTNRANHKLPKLRKLELTMSDLRLVSESYGSLIYDVLTSATELKSLTVASSYSGNTWLVMGFLRGINAPGLGKLTSISFRHLDPSNLRVLLELGNRARAGPLRLQELSLTIWGQIDAEDNVEANMLLNTFLSEQASTLRKLEITFEAWTLRPPADRRVVIRVPHAEHVREFRVTTSWEAGNQLIEYEGGRLANALPTLRRFTGDFDSMDPLDAQHMEQLTHDGVTGLKLRMRVVGLIEFPLLSSAWPAVTRLELDLKLESSDFPLVLWTLWPGLVSLRLRHLPSSTRPLDLDEVLCGIPRSHFKTLQHELSSGTQTQATPCSLEEARRLLGKYKTRPGLSDLLELREFVLIINRFQHDVPLPYMVTDIGGMFGFAMASQGIQRMVIVNEVGGKSHNGYGNDISAMCREFIRNAFGPYAIIQV